MKKRISPARLLLLVAALALSACVTTKPVGEWRSDGFSGELDNIVVIGISNRAELRYFFEDRFVDALTAVGVGGEPGYHLITSTRELSREKVENAVRGQGYDGVLITRLVGADTKEVYKLPSNYDYERGFFGYYDHAWQETSDGFSADYQVLTLQTNLYDVASGELVWSMKSQTLDASPARDIIEDQIGLTMKTLLRRGLLATN